MAIFEAFLFHGHNQPPPRLSPPSRTKENPGETGSLSGLVMDIGLGDVSGDREGAWGLISSPIWLAFFLFLQIYTWRIGLGRLRIQ